MSSNSVQPNFYLWGAWKSRIIKEPFLTKKVSGPLKKVVLGDTFIVGLKEKGQVVTWGKDAKNGCLGLGYDKQRPSEVIAEAAAPKEVEGLSQVTDIQMGQDHVVALTSNGEVFCWGRNDKGQLGVELGEAQEFCASPKKVEDLGSEQIKQIAVVRNSTFALTTSGIVYAWGDNTNNTLGLEDQTQPDAKKPVRLTLLGEMRIRRIEVFENRTIIAHVHAPETDEGGYGDFDVSSPDGDTGQAEVEIFKGIDEMRKAMEMTKEWWNHLISIKHGQPYDLPQDQVTSGAGAGTSRGRGAAREGAGSMQDDRDVDIEKLRRAEKHLDTLVKQAAAELKRTTQVPGTKNVRFILCMFIDECRLRREKVQRTISARQIVDLKRQTPDISGYSVTDFGADANEDIRKIIAVQKELQSMLDKVKVIETVDVFSTELKITLMECLENKIMLNDTRVELLKEAEGKPSDPMLPALRIIKDRWNMLKHFSLYALYQECEKKGKEFASHDEHLAYLVDHSNDQIDLMLQIDKDRIISQDSLVPALCYDLLHENAELRKMANSYQLHVLMLHMGKNISGADVGFGDLRSVGDVG